jgi:hypothetical protein
MAKPDPAGTRSTTSKHTSTMKTKINLKQQFVKVTWACATTAALLLAAMPALADWPNTNTTKWVQYPDRAGIDVLAAQPPAGTLPIILATDFLCRKPGPITDIHIWASWLGNTPNCSIPITLAIWDDVAAITNGPVPTPSHPGTRLWTQTFAPGQYSSRVWSSAIGDEWFWNPDSPSQPMGYDQAIWQLNFYPTNPFVQQGTVKTQLVYWVSMTAGANIVPFGWKTATNHWNDDAVFGHVDPNGTPMGDWQELRDPRNAANPRSLDLAVALTTGPLVTNPPPTNKWVQYPDLQGLDVNATFPNIVADDFPCTAAGTITNIQVWASWINNVTPDPNTTFVLGIWKDAPPGTTTNFSRPGTLLWSETFGPGGWTLASAGTGNEQFYDPDTGSVSPENVIWRYNFTPKQPYCQKGSTNAPTTYWLSVSARTTTPGLLFGWKTSTNHWNDDAVWGHATATGTAVGDWKDLHDPLTGISLDLAFLINTGPPSADCDPNLNPPPKFVQWPDPSTNGLDVRATAPKILGDDFLCRQSGPINAVTVWGSWLNDIVDTNAIFQLSLWTDVPAQLGTATNFSHPGQLLCTQTFYPPTAQGTAPLRYKFRPDITNVQEKFYDPNLPDAVSLIGDDTTIWRYDFYPHSPCWYQDGAPTAHKTYWLSVTALTDTNRFLFGWKTSTNHFQDDGVFGHLGSGNIPLGDWKDLHDPRSQKSLDLAFALRTFPIVGINKDLRNTTAQTATGIKIVVQGIHEITWHYDSSWPVFAANYSSGNTELLWTGGTLPSGAITHVGFEMAGTKVTIASMSWLSGLTVIGTPIQVNYHMWGNGNSLTLNNDFVGDVVIPNGGLVEFHANAVPLDQMVPGSNRNPIASIALPIQPTPLQTGCPMRILLPPAPPGAQYALFVVNLNNAQGQPATMDFVQFPLDTALRPTIEPTGLMDSFFDVFFSPVPGRTYRVRESPTLLFDSFFDVFTELSLEDGGNMHLKIPISGPQGFHRIVLDPE